MEKKRRIARKVDAEPFREFQKQHGKLHLKMYDEQKKKVLDRVIDNLILIDGREIWVDRAGGIGGQTAIWGIAIGDDNTPPVDTQTDLIGTELGRKVTSNAQPDTGVLRCSNAFGPGEATGTWEEAVLIDTDAAKGARKCACRVLTGSIVKGAGNTISAVWDVDFP